MLQNPLDKNEDRVWSTKNIKRQRQHKTKYIKVQAMASSAA